VSVLDTTDISTGASPVKKIDDLITEETATIGGETIHKRSIGERQNINESTFSVEMAGTHTLKVYYWNDGDGDPGDSGSLDAGYAAQRDLVLKVKKSCALADSLDINQVQGKLEGGVIIEEIKPFLEYYGDENERLYSWPGIVITDTYISTYKHGSGVET